MRKGTTPTHEFMIPFSIELIKECQIIYCQNGKEVLTKYKRNCTLDGNTIAATLSQDETFEFDENTTVEIQLRVLTKKGEALASDIICVSCERCLSEDVLL